VYTVPKSSSRLRGVFAALLISASCVAALWLWAVPDVLSPSTFAFLATFMIGAATVTLLTWRNAQATTTIAQLLQATDAAGLQRPRTDVRTLPVRSE
jgi:hypothetical protein